MKSTKQENQLPQRSARTRWIAVGDASKFVVFEKKLGKSLSQVKCFTNEAAHLKVSDLTTGQPGRSFNRASKSSGGHQTGTPRHSYGSEQNPKKVAVEEFIRNVSAFLDSSCGERSFENLVLITNDRLLGRLRCLLDKTTQAKVSEQHAKDLAWMSGNELVDRVESLLALS